MRAQRSIELLEGTGGGEPRALTGSQTLVRGLEVMQAVSDGAINLTRLAETLRLTRSTTHRLAATLVEHRYLTFTPQIGYALGPKLLELGFMAGRQMSLPRLAREHLEAVAAATGDTVHLGVLDGVRALYLDKIPGRRRIEISSRVGERQPLRSTGLGKALILDEDDARWREIYDYEEREGQRYGVDLGLWLKRMRDYAERGYAFDLEENEDRIRCVAAPVRDVASKIVAAISVSSAAQYMDDERMERLGDDVRMAALAISKDLGWSEAPNEPLPGKPASAGHGRKRA
jgi:DNA-binding IclR family transcriptional regulator